MAAAKKLGENKNFSLKLNLTFKKLYDIIFIERKKERKYIKKYYNLDGQRLILGVDFSQKCDIM